MRFNAITDLLDTMEAMRYRDNEPEAKKILWIIRNEEGSTLEEKPLSAVGSATWLDQGKPWAIFTREDVVYNVDVQEYNRHKWQ